MDRLPRASICGLVLDESTFVLFKVNQMEKMLQKLAHQLESLDEASLMSLWSKYATITSRFEPTKRWEEACLIFSLIQAKHWKNQLFNYCWSQQRKPPLKNAQPQASPEVDLDFGLEQANEKPAPKKPECRILSFRRPEASAAQGRTPADKE